LNRFRISIISFVVLSLVVLAGCSPAGSAGSGARKIATFDGGDVTQSELQRQVEAAAQQSGSRAGLQGGIEPGTEQYKQIAKSIMPQVVGNEIALAYAEQNGITVSDKALQERIQQTKQQIASQSQSRGQGQNVSPEEAYQRALQQAGLTEEEARSLIRRQLLLQKVQEQVVGNVEISDEEARKYYEQNKEQRFTQPKQVCVGRILFTPDQEKKSQEIKKKIESGDADFAKMAKKYSQDPQSAEKGGDVGCVPLQQFPEKLNEAVSDAEKGDLVGPVKTEFGYEIVRVKDVKPKQSTPYEEVSSQIKSQLSQQKQSEEFQKWLQNEREQRNVEYLAGYEPQQSGGGQTTGR